MNRELVIVRGGGDLATGTIHKLHRSGFKVLVLEVPKPTCIRRTVSLGEAVFEGEITVEGVTARHVTSIQEMERAWEANQIPVMVDPKGQIIDKLHPKVVIDAIIAKKNLGTHRGMADITIALGPGFTAGEDVDVVIETQRGHRLGRLIFEGQAQKNTGIPGPIGGYAAERVIHAEAAGIMQNIAQIGDVVEAGQTLAYIGNQEVKATIPGVLRGLLRSGSKVTLGFKIADIDPRLSELENCYTISDKARCIAGGVLEAVMYQLDSKAKNQPIPEPMPKRACM